MSSIERQLQLLDRGEKIRQLPKQPNDPFEAGEMVERERIIKLLEDNKWRDEVVFDLVIALIKGENK